MERRRVAYTGRVQGVGFRATTRSMAGGFAVTGWVRNEPDGRVVVEVQGEPAEVARFLAAVGARMSGLIRHESAESVPPIASETDFVIAR